MDINKMTHFFVLIIQVRTCHQCQKRKPSFRSAPAELHPVPVSPVVFKQWGVDLIGPLAVKSHGNRFIIAATDYFLTWPEAIYYHYIIYYQNIMDTFLPTLARVHQLIHKQGMLEEHCLLGYLIWFSEQIMLCFNLKASAASHRMPVPWKVWK